MNEQLATAPIGSGEAYPAVTTIKDLFESLATEWKSKSYYMSNNVEMAALDSYQRIVAMGWPVVPLILEEMQRQPKQWFWALEAITGENPVPNEAAGDVLLKTKAWIEWGKSRGLIKP